MAFTLQEIEQLRDRSDGWEVVWNRLWGDLDLRIHELLFNGAPNDPASWSLKPRFKMLRDESTAQDFLSDLLFDYDRRAKEGTLLASFKGTPVQLLPFLATPDFLKRRATDHLTKVLHQGIINLPSDHDVAPSVRPIDLEGFDVADQSISRNADDVLRVPLKIEFRPGGTIGATIRMAAVQCWPRLSADQSGRGELESHLCERLTPPKNEDPITALISLHKNASQRLVRQLRAIDDQIMDTPGMHEPRRAALDTQRVKIQVDLLLAPLDREALQTLMALSDNAIFQQVTRYKRSYTELFPDLEERLDAIVRGSR